MDWLFVEDEYKPVKDRGNFINRSMLSILKVLSKLERAEGTKRGIIYEFNPSLKLFSTLLTIVIISLSRSILFLSLIGLFVLLNIILLKSGDRKKTLTLSIVAAFFTAFMLAPSMIIGNAANSLIITFKVLMTVSMVNILSLSSRWIDISTSLKYLFIPDIFILVLELTLKYIYLLGEISLDMLTALKLKSIGKNNDKYSSMTSLMGNLFLKSKEMGEELYYAMECRGFTGEYKRRTRFKFSNIDIVYAIIMIALTAAYFITRG